MWEKIKSEIGETKEKWQKKVWEMIVVADDGK